MSVTTDIQSILDQHPITLFMKGTPDFPMCGFSGKVTQILRQIGARFHGINVLENESIRQGIKEYANWPTIPQLYINGEFIGGCDIVTELYENGELAKLLAATSQ